MRPSENGINLPMRITKVKPFNKDTFIAFMQSELATDKPKGEVYGVSLVPKPLGMLVVFAKSNDGIVTPYNIHGHELPSEPFQDVVDELEAFFQCGVVFVTKVCVRPHDHANMAIRSQELQSAILDHKRANIKATVFDIVPLLDWNKKQSVGMYSVRATLMYNMADIHQWTNIEYALPLQMGIENKSLALNPIDNYEQLYQMIQGFYHQTKCTQYYVFKNSHSYVFGDQAEQLENKSAIMVDVKYIEPPKDLSYETTHMRVIKNDNRRHIPINPKNPSREDRERYVRRNKENQTRI